MSNYDPTSVTAVAGAAGTGTATVSWSQPVNGAPPFYTVITGSLATQVPGTSTSVVITGLSIGQSYAFRVTTPLTGYSTLSSTITIPGLVPTPIQVLIRKIRAAMAAADNNNCVDLPPLGVPRAWTTGQIYAFGEQVTNDTSPVKQYCCCTYNSSGSTAGATGPTGLGATPYSLISDGTINWCYTSSQRTSTALADSPTLTITNSGIPSQQFQFYTGGANPFPGASSQFRLVGGIPFAGAAGTLCAGSYPGPGNGNVTPPGYPTNSWTGTTPTFLEFETDSPKVAFTTGNGASPGSPPGVEINNRRMLDGALGTNSAGGGASFFYIVDFSAAGGFGRKRRKIRINAAVLGGSFSVYIVGVDPASKVWLPQNPNRYRILVDGDSLSAGAQGTNTNLGPFTPGGYWTQQFASLIGCDDIINGAVGGTGYINPGTGPSTTYLQRLQIYAPTFSPDVLIVAGNFNDSAYSSAQRQAAVQQYATVARELLPNALIIFLGTWAGNNGGSGSSPSATILIMENDIAAGVAAYVANSNDPYVFFYAESQDPFGGAWITGIGSVASNTGTGNADILVASNLTNPHGPQVAHDYAARRIYNAFRQIINSINV